MEGTWEEAAKRNFEALISAVPGPLREIARKRVLSRIQLLMQADNLSRVGVHQVVEAFRWETPGMYRPQIAAKIKELGLEGYWQEHE